MHRAEPRSQQVSDLSRSTLQKIVQSEFGPGFELKLPVSDEKTSSNSVLYEVEHNEEVLLLRLERAPTEGLAEVDLPQSEYVVDQEIRIVHAGVLGELRLTLRPRLDHVLSDLDDAQLSKILGVTGSSENALRARWDLLESVLLGLRDLRRSQMTFDLRPSNIGFDEASSRWQLLDWGRPPGHHPAVRGIRNIDDDASVQASFGALIQRMLGNYVWDSRDLPAVHGLATDSFEWVLDYYAAVRDERPAAEEVINATFGIVSAGQSPALQAADQRIRTTLEELRSSGSAQSLSPDRGAYLSSRLSRYPETSLYASSKRRVEHALRLLDLVIGKADCYPKERMINNFSEFASVKAPYGEIDDEWRDRLHRAHFGEPLDLDHERRMRAAENSGEDLPGRENYLRHLAVAAMFRADLLRRVPMAHTDQVVEIMQTGFPDMAVQDVVTLRRWGDILAVRDHGRWLYPTFQFGSNGMPHDLIGVASESFGESSDKWTDISWWAVARRSLGGVALMDVIGTRKGAESVGRALESARAA